MGNIGSSTGSTRGMIAEIDADRRRAGGGIGKPGKGQVAADERARRGAHALECSGKLGTPKPVVEFIHRCRAGSRKRLRRGGMSAGSKSFGFGLVTQCAGSCRRRSGRLAKQSGKPQAQVARELGIRPDMLRSWKRQAEGSAGFAAADVFPGNGNVPSQDDKVRRLRREVDQLKQERAFLKKPRCAPPRTC